MYIPKFDASDKDGSMERMGDAVNDGARGLFIADGYHVPIYFLFDDYGEATIFPAKIENDQDKDRVSNTLKIFISDNKIYGVISIMEAWIYNAKNKNDDVIKQLLDGKSRVSEMDDKQEALIVSMETRDGNKIMWLNPISRTNNLVKLGKIDRQVFKKDECSGRLCNWFDDPEIVPYECPKIKQEDLN